MTKFRTICLHRTEIDEDSYSCSRNGQLVSKGCCLECERKLLATEGEKAEHDIKINNRLIEYHQSEIGRLRQENLKLQKIVGSEEKRESNKT